MNQEIIDTLKSYEMVQAFDELKLASKEWFDHKFKGFGWADSEIRVTIYVYQGYNLVIFQDLGRGTSVTNASEQLATEVGRLKSLDPLKTVWLECYPYYGGDYDVDQITYLYDPSEDRYTNPEWKPCKNKIVIDFLRRTLTL